MAMLHIDNVHFAYQKRKILNNLSFSIRKGESVSLIGASGSGKTTLFRVMTGLLTPEDGTISINGIYNNFSEISYMHQEDLLLPWKTALDNLLLIHKFGNQKFPRKELEIKARYLLEKVGLKGYETSYPHELSGGMRQRISLARTLLQKRSVFLLDEPFGSLDVMIREELYELINTIIREEQITLLFVTHDFRDAFCMTDRILVLGDGQIVSSFFCPPEIKQDPIQSNDLIKKIRNMMRAPKIF